MKHLPRRRAHAGLWIGFGRISSRVVGAALVFATAVTLAGPSIARADEPAPSSPTSAPSATPTTDALLKPPGLLAPDEPCKTDADCEGLCDHGVCRYTEKRKSFLLYAESNTGPSGYRVIAPLWFQRWTRTTDAKVFFPFYFQHRDEGRGLKRLLLPFVYRQTESTDASRHRAITVVGNYFRDADDRGSSQGVLPLFYSFYDKTSQARTSLVLPIFALHTSPTSRFAYLGPFYGYKGQHGWAGGVFPIAMFGRSDKLSYGLVPPVFFRFADDRGETSVLGPIYYHRDLPAAGAAREGWDAGFIPLAFMGRHADRRYFSLAGLITVATSTAGFSSVIGPLYLSSSRAPNGEESHAYGLAPLLNFSKSATGRVEWLLPPLYLHYSNPDKSRLFTLFGLFFRARDERGLTEGFFPVVWKFESPTRHLRLALPLYARDIDDARHTDVLQVGPYLRVKNDATQATTHLFLPLFVKHDAPDYHVTVQFPFFWQVRTKDETDTIAFPFYYRIRKPTLAADVLFPVAWRFANPEAHTATTVVGPVYHHSTPDGSDSGFAPIVGWGSRPERKSGHFWFGPLALYHGHDDVARTSRTVALTFFLDRNKDDWTSVLFPLFAGWRRGTLMRWVGPLAFHSQDDGKNKSLSFITLAFWGHSPQRTFGGLFPLLFHYGYNDGSSSTTLLPLFHFARKSDGGVRLITLLFGAFTSPSGTRAYVGPFYVRKADEGTSVALFPLFYHAHEKSGTSTTFLVPLFLHRSTPETSLLGVTPLFWRYKSIEATTNLLFPFFLDRDVHYESRTTAFGIGIPLFLRHVNYATHTTNTFALPVFYRTSPTEKDVVVFPLFWHFRSGENWSQLFLPFYLHMHRAHFDYTVVLNFYFKKGHGDREGAWSFHFFPIFNVGRPSPGDYEWGIFGGLIGYQRIGRRRTLKLIWSYEVPLEPVAAPVSGGSGSGDGPGGGSSLSLTPPDLFF